VIVHTQLYHSIGDIAARAGGGRTPSRGISGVHINLMVRGFIFLKDIVNYYTWNNIKLFDLYIYLHKRAPLQVVPLTIIFSYLNIIKERSTDKNVLLTACSSLRSWKSRGKTTVVNAD